MKYNVVKNFNRSYKRQTFFDDLKIQGSISIIARFTVRSSNGTRWKFMYRLYTDRFKLAVTHILERNRNPLRKRH